MIHCFCITFDITTSYPALFTAPKYVLTNYAICDELIRALYLSELVSSHMPVEKEEGAP